MNHVGLPEYMARKQEERARLDSVVSITYDRLTKTGRLLHTDIGYLTLVGAACEVLPEFTVKLSFITQAYTELQSPDLGLNTWQAKHTDDRPPTVNILHGHVMHDDLINHREHYGIVLTRSGERVLTSNIPPNQ